MSLILGFAIVVFILKLAHGRKARIAVTGLESLCERIVVYNIYYILYINIYIEYNFFMIYSTLYLVYISILYCI